MVQAEGEIECRIAIAGRFGIENDRAIRTGKNVLGAEIAMHQGDAGTAQSVGDGTDAVRTVRMRFRGMSADKDRCAAP